MCVLSLKRTSQKTAPKKDVGGPAQVMSEVVRMSLFGGCGSVCRCLLCCVSVFSHLV